MGRGISSLCDITRARSEVEAQGLRGSGRSEGQSFSHFWEFSLETAERQEKNRTFHIYKKEDMQQADEVTAGTVPTVQCDLR